VQFPLYEQLKITARKFNSSPPIRVTLARDNYVLLSSAC
jgi:hypothetical protein